MTDRGQNIYK